MKTSQTSIELRNVGVDFPVFNASNMSFKNRVLSAVTGGAIDRKHDGSVIVKGLQNINLSIKAGERVGLIGHNGAGKTTLLRVLSGIYAPTEGEAIINGECVSLINIGLGIDPEATGRENIKLRSAMIGFTPKQTKELTEEIIEFSGLGSFIEMPFRTYSTGMQLRLAFAVSTIVSPHILILDEWLSTGDENFRQRAEERMRQVVDSTDILVLASHVPELLKDNCDRVVWLEHGRIRMDGEVAKVLDEYFGPEMQNNQGKRKPDLEAAPKGIPPVEDLMKRLQRSPREIVFPAEEQPGNDVAKIISCRLVDDEGRAITCATTTHAFHLEIRYVVRQEGHCLWTTCIVSDGAGAAIFWSGDTAPPLLTQARAPGVWISRLKIPGRLLSPGLVSFSVAVGNARVPGRNYAHASSILPVYIEDDLNDRYVRGPYRGPIPGVFRPKLDWQTGPADGKMETNIP